MSVSLALVLVGVLGGAAWLSAQSRCRHLDEDGRSMLVWTHRDGRLRGWCPHCERVTRGWDVPGAGPRPTLARVATPEEIAQLQAARRAGRRGPRRVRRAA